VRNHYCCNFLGFTFRGREIARDIVSGELLGLHEYGGMAMGRLPR